MIQRWIEFIRRGHARSHVVFLADYDMRMAEHLVQGVDLWLNTRAVLGKHAAQWMKVLVNGVSICPNSMAVAEHTPTM